MNSNFEEPLISVVIPCYNVSQFVEKATASIISQTYKNLEIWLIDDGSTDDTLQKIRLIKDERIRIAAFKENTQKVGAVNDVLKKVNGEFIVLQDADDWSEPERIQEQYTKFMEDSELGICFTGYNLISGKIVKPGRIALRDEELKNEFLNYNLDRSPGTSPTICATMMITKDVLQKHPGYHEYFAGRVAEDIQWVYRILKEFKGGTVDKALYNYSMRHGSFSQIQSTGLKPKYTYAWHLLSKIIHKDVHENIDVLAPENSGLLARLELEACEEVLSETTKLLHKTRHIYENSMNFKLGKLMLWPWRFMKSFNR